MTERTDVKKVWKFFSFAQYEKKAKFLSDMAEQGWRFVRTDSFCYTFEHCEPEQMTYRLAFKGNPFQKREEFYAKFRAYGWEHVQDFNGFSYFRKSAANAVPEDSDLFHSALSQFAMVKRAAHVMLIPIILICFVLLLFMFRNSDNLLVNGKKIAESLETIAFLILLLLFAVIFLVRTAADYVFLKKNTKTESIKQVFMRFSIADYEKAEQYLTEMASQGWRLVTFTAAHYIFERCEPEKVVYRLDYSGKKKPSSDYYTMFRDYGWEFVANVARFNYFRKPAEGVSPEDLEIFSDGESHLEMVKKLIMFELLPMLPLICVVVLSNISDIRAMFLEGPLSTAGWVFVITLSVLMILCVLRWAKICADFVRLRRKYKKTV